MKYDVIVVGAGSAGSVMAGRLSEDPERSVLLLEAGPDYPDFETLPDELKYGYATATDIMISDHNWQFIGKGTEQAEPMLVPRGKVTGGTSAINGQMFIRGLPEDYDTWASLGNDEWSYEKLLPYLRKLETDTDFHDDFHGSDGPIIARRFKREEWMPAQTAFYGACKALGLPESADLNHPDATGVMAAPLNNPNGIRWSTSLGFLGPARHRLNLTIRANCTTHRVLFEGKRAIGVEVESGGEKFTAFADEIVLSSGTIGSPQILLLSGVGPAEDLRSVGVTPLHDLPGVGQNLRDHPLAFVTWKTKPEFLLDGLAPRMQLCARYTAAGSDLRDDMFLIMQSFAVERVNRGGDRMTSLGIRMIVALYHEDSAGELKLASTDPNVQPFLDFGLLQESFDLERMREGVRFAVKLGEQPDFADIIEELIDPLDSDLESEDTLDEWLMREITTGQHITSTCKMGPATDPMAVVDQYGRVHGLEGLRVVDASIMPDCVRANTNVTTMTMGERIADFMRTGR